MKKIDRFIWLVITGFLVLTGLVNGMLIWGGASDGGRFYRVSVNRIKAAVRAYELKEGRAPDSLDVLLRSIRVLPDCTRLQWMPRRRSWHNFCRMSQRTMLSSLRNNITTALPIKRTIL